MDRDKVCIFETRRLTLPLETPVDAVIEFDRLQTGTLWQQVITESRLVPGTKPVLLVASRLPGHPPERREFDLPTLAAAIIHYCVRARIPLPRNGRKAIDITSDGVTFSIESTVNLDRRHARPGLDDLSPR